MQAKTPKSILLMAALCLFASVAKAEVTLNHSRIWQRARAIAIGQQVWEFKASYQEYSDQFGADSRVESLGQGYDRALTWQQLLAADSPAGRAEMQDYMRRHSVGQNDVAAMARYQIQRQETGLSADWAYGLTRTWMIGFQVPLTYRRTRVKTDVELSPVLARGSKAAGGSHSKSVLGLSQDGMREKVADLSDQQLRDNGYDGLPSQKNTWDWGDVSLLSQIQLADSYSWTWAFQQTVRLPTARNPSVADYLQTNSDDGQIDVGLTSLLDYRQRRWLSGIRFGYVAQLADSIRMHVPDAPKEIDPSVHRDLGDYAWASVDVERRLTRRFTGSVEYSYLKKASDRYWGQSANGYSDYGSLGKDTSQELHQTRAGVQYRIGDSASRSGIENKWVASLDYTFPWVGRNSIDASRTSLELISYF